jgi:hypothetical protein
MNMLADFTAATRELMAVLGDTAPGTITRGATVKTLTLFVDDALQDVGQHGRVVGNKRVVGAMNTDWLFQRGDIVTVRGGTAKVQELLSNDGIVNTVVLHG